MADFADFTIRAAAYLRYLILAKDEHSLHSPFIFQFYEEVVRHPYSFYAYEQLERERAFLLSNHEKIHFEEAGAGVNSGPRSISGIASGSLMPFFKSSFLLRLCHWLKPENVIELGTCLGLSSAYMAQACGKLYSFEASSALANHARFLWKKLEMNNIELKEGKIEETLPDFLEEISAGWDLCILDANHRYEATMSNFQLLKNTRPDRACLVFDDIYWSAGMAKAWKEIQSDPSVQISIDLFHLGIVFFRPESSKQHFVLKW